MCACSRHYSVVYQMSENRSPRKVRAQCTLLPSTLATALAVLSGTLLSVPLFGFELTHTFALGASCTVGATALYSLGHEGGKRPAQPAEQEQELQKEPLCKP